MSRRHSDEPDGRQREATVLGWPWSCTPVGACRTVHIALRDHPRRARRVDRMGTELVGNPLSGRTPTGRIDAARRPHHGRPSGGPNSRRRRPSERSVADPRPAHRSAGGTACPNPVPQVARREVPGLGGYRGGGAPPDRPVHRALRGRRVGLLAVPEAIEAWANDAAEDLIELYRAAAEGRWTFRGRRRRRGRCLGCAPVAR